MIGASELLAGIGLVLPSVLLILPWLMVVAAAGLVLFMLCAGIVVVRNSSVPSVTFSFE
ncbi:DoxX family protein [Dictyobacter halimunensis]|uniref:DoxX family protein n=1 Tax=Dictyobacter halimunensis TaxID=3026934 RepID=UPI003B97DC3B